MTDLRAIKVQNQVKEPGQLVDIWSRLYIKSADHQQALDQETHSSLETYSSTTPNRFANTDDRPIVAKMP
jgi:hypothetical protein